MKCSWPSTGAMIQLIGGVNSVGTFGGQEMGLRQTGFVHPAPLGKCTQKKQEETSRSNPSSTHIATTRYMFYIIFGATPRLHIGYVQLLVKNMYLESQYVGKTPLSLREKR